MYDFTTYHTRMSHKQHFTNISHKDVTQASFHKHITQDVPQATFHKQDCTQAKISHTLTHNASTLLFAVGLMHGNTLPMRSTLVGRIPRFGRVSGYMRDVLHWLPYPQRIVYRISALVRRCIEGLAPSYLRELCCSTVTIQRRIALRSSAQAELLVPRTRTVI